MTANWHVRGAMLLIAILIAIRPGLGETEQEKAAPGSDLEVLLVVDRTVSMSALDHAGVRSRLEGVRTDLDEIVAALPNAQLAVVTFGKSATLDLPFTSDPDAVLPTIDELTREPLLAGTGTSVDRPLPLVRKVLRRAAQQHPGRTRILVFASDGENTLVGHRQRSFAPLAEYVDGGAVFGYGSAAGGLMPTGGEPPWEFVRDLRTGEDAVSRLDEANLRRVADEIGVDYAARGSAASLEEWARGLTAAGDDADGADDGEAKYQLYWLLALVLVGLAGLELRLSWLAFAEARRVVQS